MLCILNDVFKQLIFSLKTSYLASLEIARLTRIIWLLILFQSDFMRLVVQGASLSHAHLAHIHALMAAPRGVQYTQIAERAYYLPAQTKLPDSVKDFCVAEKIDVALVADQHTLSKIKLCVMDMDSTLITIECIDEIADMHGIKPQIAAITEATMRGELDFAQSLKQRVALLKGLDESALQRVIDERLKLSPGAVEWINTCKQHNIKTMLVSGGFDFFANHVQNLLGLDYAEANVLEIIDGKLTGNIWGAIVDAQAKADHLNRLRSILGLETSQVIAIGDGANDLNMMSEAAAGIAYRAKPVVQAQASYALNFSGLDGVIHLLNTAV